jgi:ribosome maturation factor RimP
MSARQARALRALAEPIAASHDCDLEDVVIRWAGKRRLVRVTVDHDGGLSMDVVAAISRGLSRALDRQDMLGDAPYVLEVSSPGVDRPLRLPRHWARARGRLVEVNPNEGVPFSGRVVESDDASAVLDVDGARREVQFAQIKRAVVQVEFHNVDDVELDAEEELPGAGDDEDAAGPGEAPAEAPGEDAAGGPAEGVEDGGASPEEDAAGGASPEEDAAGGPAEGSKGAAPAADSPHRSEEA